MEPLEKLRKITTPNGIYQHGKLNDPDPRFGYALEDQARALIVAIEFKDAKLSRIYLNFIIKAQREDGLLYHFFYDDKFKEPDTMNGLFKNEEFSCKSNKEEAYGLTLWSLLKTYSNSFAYNNIIARFINNYDRMKNTDDIIKKISTNLIDDAYTWTSPRAISAALLGLSNLNYEHKLEKELKAKLHNLYFNSRTDDWEWFENFLVYANAIIPWSLWEIYLKRKCKDSLKIAKKTTDFLISTCQERNFPAPVGNKGWYIKSKEKALFDQQPIDTGYMVCCLEKAFYATKDNYYLWQAKKWYQWFWGHNIMNASLIDKKFACFDGLTPEGLNLNQGAESNICFLMAYAAAKRLGILNENK